MVHVRSWFGAAALLLTSGVFTAAQGTAHAAPSTDLTAAVTRKLLDRSAADRPATRVTVTRHAGQEWASGTAVVVAPHQDEAYPKGWVFVAHAQPAGDWQVAFDGEAGFADLAGAAPAAVVSGREKQVFSTPSAPEGRTSTARYARTSTAQHAGTSTARYVIAPAVQDAGTPKAQYTGQDYRTGMRLPYGLGQAWQLRGGPHGWNGDDEPWSSIDLAGGDQRVLAARGGTAYTMCKGWIRIIHDRGYATDYYHLWNSIDVDGAHVDEGAYLGDTGTDVTCGGVAHGRHVHFALRQNDAYVPIEGHNLGTWVIMNGDGIYRGYALHGSTRVNAVVPPDVLPGTNGGAPLATDATLYNYGALALNQGVIDTNGAGPVQKRSGPGTTYPVAGSAADGTTVTISCSATGTSTTGRWGTNSLWNRLSDGTWVPDAFTWTGIDEPVAGAC
ncbi:M23 family metallopeptidase [Planosporangium sp. 12N6]|uniref:M23 family metallopeptidase n=1 Tax=Planosporangium spinosum TaxID=3402278 RepID=UPI003CE81101